MAGDTTNLGKAVITVEVDSSKVASGMQQAQQQAQGAVGGISGPGAFADYGGSISGLNYGGSTGMVIGAGLEQVEVKAKAATVAVKETGVAVEESLVKSFKRSTQEVTSLLARMSAVGGVAATFYALGDAIGSGLVGHMEDGTEKAKRFKEELDLRDAEGVAKQLAARLEEVNGQLADALETQERIGDSPAGGLGFDVKSETRLKQLRDEAKQLNQDVIAANENVSGMKKASDRAQDERDKAAYQRRREEVEQEMAAKKAMQLEAAEQQRELDEAEAKRNEYLDAETAAKKREAAEEQYERDVKNAERIAEAVEKAFTRAIQSTRDRSAGLFNVGEITNSIELLGQKLDAISRNTRSRL